MSTRQLRLNDRDKILQKLPLVQGQKIQVVLRDQTVCFVIVVGIRGPKLEALNMRQKKIDIPIDSINEIYVDTKE
jgi:hypothetical protein